MLLSYWRGPVYLRSVMLQPRLYDEDCSIPIYQIMEDSSVRGKNKLYNNFGLSRVWTVDGVRLPVDQREKISVTTDLQLHLNEH